MAKTEEDLKQMMELQGKYMDLNRQNAQISAQMQALEREKTRARLTLRELEELPEGTIAYKAIGKMFLQQPPKDLMDDMVKMVTKSEEELINLSKTKTQVESQTKDTEKQIQELLKT